MENKIICWWSGGITSAVACKLAIDIYGVDNCRVIMIDTQNEHPDTYRFKNDCEKWYGLEIEIITGIGEKYGNIFDVWRKHKSLNTATGAICSTNLKRLVREKWEKVNTYKHQVFGFEFDKKEFNRALSMTMNHGKRVKAIYPLLLFGYDKKDCLKIVEEQGKKGAKKLLVFSPAFIADCLETIVEIGEEYQEIFEEFGGEKVQLVPSSNDHPLFINCLETLVRERL